MNVQLANIHYCDKMKNVWEAFCNVHKEKSIKNKNVLFNKGFSPSRYKDGL
jgi:hypothetical protein